MAKNAYFFGNNAKKRPVSISFSQEFLTQTAPFFTWPVFQIGEMNNESAVARLFRILHHRSLTLSVIATFLALIAITFLPESDYRLRHLGADYLLPASVIAISGFAVCCLTFVNLLRDDKSGYEGFRLSVATLLWALACIPISFISLIVIAGLSS